MLEDDVLREVRAVREAFAQAHNYDVRAMVADLRARNAAGGWPIVRRPRRRPNPALMPAGGRDQPLETTAAG
jgi:hypothetical protein